MEQREEVPLTLVAGIIYIPAVLSYFWQFGYISRPIFQIWSWGRCSSAGWLLKDAAVWEHTYRHWALSEHISSFGNCMFSLCLTSLADSLPSPRRTSLLLSFFKLFSLLYFLIESFSQLRNDCIVFRGSRWTWSTTHVLPGMFRSYVTLFLLSWIKSVLFKWFRLCQKSGRWKPIFPLLHFSFTI